MHALTPAERAIEYIHVSEAALRMAVRQCFDSVIPQLQNQFLTIAAFRVAPPSTCLYSICLVNPQEEAPPSHA